MGHSPAANVHVGSTLYPTPQKGVFSQGKNSAATCLPYFPATADSREHCSFTASGTRAVVRIKALWTGYQALQTGARSAPGTHQFTDVLTPHLTLRGLLPVQRDPQQPVEQEAQALHAGAQGEEWAVETGLDVEPAEEKQPRFCVLQHLEGSAAHSSFINQESRKD